MEQENKKNNTNKIMLVGFGLILIVITITMLRPAFKKTKQEEAPKDPVEVYNDYDYITAKELREKIQKKEEVVMLDIRDSVNYEKEHIEGAANLTPDKIKENISELNKNDFIVIIGYNFEDKKAEAGAIKFFKDSGFTNIKALSGGMLAWNKSLHPTVNLGDPESAVDVSKIEKIAPEQLKLAIENEYPVFIIDTRDSASFEEGHIPGAVNIPFEKLEDKKSEIPMSDEIIVYGNSPLEDFQSGVKLYDLGFLANYILDGGFSSWQEKRYPLEK
jgi:rhodanese-related sulfurtransferase